MKYFKNTAKTRMYIDKSTIYFNNGKQFCTKKRDCLGKIEKSFSHKLTDYFIQDVRKVYDTTNCCILQSWI